MTWAGVGWALALERLDARLPAGRTLSRGPTAEAVHLAVHAWSVRYGLTPTQALLLSLAAWHPDATTKDLAIALDVQPDTVKQHSHQVTLRTGRRSLRTAALAMLGEVVSSIPPEARQ